MLLAIDAGNTTLTLALGREGEPIRSRRAATHPIPTPDDLELLLDGLLAQDGRTLADADRIVVASVVPALSMALAALARRRGVPLLEASAASVPLPVRVERPAEVGADRLMNALAAARLHGVPAIVVDVGTAMTVDAIASDGSFAGGAIAAGPQLALDAIAARTAQLPPLELLPPERAIGRDTAGAMRSGAVIGLFGAIRELVGRIRDELLAGTPERRVTVVLTGGLSRASWAAEIPGIDVIDPDLTLRGLEILAREGRWQEAPPADMPQELPRPSAGAVA